MPSSPVPVGKRPDLRQSRSAGWSWPRLIPIHEQQSRLSQASQSSVSPSVRDRSEQEQPPNATISAINSAEEDAPPSPIPSAVDRSPTAEGSVAGVADHQPNEQMHSSLSSVASSDDEKRRASSKKAASSATHSVENVVEEDFAGSERGSVDDPVEKNISGSERGSIHDVADMRDSALERERFGETVAQSDSEIPVGYESNIADVQLEEEMPTTNPASPIPPVMDRISVQSNSVPYYATPKILVHKPSQSSQAENPASHTIDEVLANERRSLPQGGNDQLLEESVPDGNLIDGPPMESMSLAPIAWQNPQDHKVHKRNLYIRKLRNAAARKTILKATLGRQLAVPTKQMLRLLANGENVVIPDLSNYGVEAATVLVPKKDVTTVTGTVLVPQDGLGAASNDMGSTL